jgi:hypothetical protein
VFGAAVALLGAVVGGLLAGRRSPARHPSPS